MYHDVWLPQDAGASFMQPLRGKKALTCILMYNHDKPKMNKQHFLHFQAFSKGNLSFHLNNVHFKDKEFMCRMCHFKTAYKGEYLDQLRSTFRVRREGYLCRAEPFKLVPPFVIFFLLFIRFFAECTCNHWKRAEDAPGKSCAWGGRIKTSIVLIFLNKGTLSRSIISVIMMS